MADFATLTLAETAAKAKLRQALFRKIKDNFDNLDGRATVIENDLLIFDHFLSDDGSGYSFQMGGDYDVAGGAGPPAGWNGTWWIDRKGVWMYQGYDGTTRDGTIYNAAKPDPSVARVSAVSASAGRYSNLYGLDRFRFDRITKPLIYTARVKFATDQAFLLGLRDGFKSESLTVDRHGIWMERVDSSNWRFVSYDGTRNNGANFTKVTSGNWFEVKIEFTDTPADRAFCYVDGVLKQTLTANMPTTAYLCWAQLLHGNAGTPGNVDYDRTRLQCLAVLDAA